MKANKAVTVDKLKPHFSFRLADRWLDVVRDGELLASVTFDELYEKLRDDIFDAARKRQDPKVVEYACEWAFQFSYAATKLLSIQDCLSKTGSPRLSLFAPKPTSTKDILKLITLKKKTDTSSSSDS